MQKYCCTTLLFIVLCGALCSCTTVSNKTHTQSIERISTIQDVPKLIGETPLQYEKWDSGTFSPDGTLLGTCYKNKIRIHSVSDGSIVHTIFDALKEIREVAFSSNSKQFAYVYYHKKRKLYFYQIIDVESGKNLKKSVAVRGIPSIPTIALDDNRLAFIRSSNAGQTFYLQTFSTNKIITALKLHSQGSSFVTFTHDNKHVVIACSKEVWVIDARSGKIVRKWHAPFPSKHTSIDFALSSDSQKLVARHGLDGVEKHFLTSLDLSTGKHLTVQIPKQDYPLETFMVSSDGTIFLAWNLCKKIHEYSLDKLVLKRMWAHYGDFSQVMYAGSEKILIGTKEYVRTPDALFASVQNYIAGGQLKKAESQLDKISMHYGSCEQYDLLASNTLPCIDTLVLQQKADSADNALEMLGCYFPESIGKIKPTDRLILVAESLFKKGKYDSATNLFSLIKRIYPNTNSTAVASAMPVSDTNSVILGTNKAKKRYKNLASSIERYIKKKEAEYVTLKEYSLPVPVKKPKMPRVLKVTQNKFETDEAFTRRVDEEKKLRAATIQKIMKGYRQDVASYNNAVTHLEQLRNKRISELADKRPSLIANALKDTLQSVHVENPHFDRESGMLAFDLVGDGAPYRTRIGTKVLDSGIAEQLYKKSSTASWSAIFTTSRDGFNLESVTCLAAETNLVFKKIDTASCFENSTPKSVFIASSSIDELSKLISIEKQSSELSEYQSDITLVFNDGRKVKTSGDTKLSREIDHLAYAPVQSKNYLLAIGIENYKSAPNVPFAENSLKLVASLLQKKFGIPKENQILLTSTDATGQAIQGNMRNLAARLLPNDRLFFYYAGHGLASRNGKDVFMLPSDAVRGAYEDEDFSINSMIKKYFSKVGRAYVFLDTCFSGRASTQSMLTKGIAPVYKTTPYSLPSNVTVFFAGQGDQYANFYPQQGHRLFSYFIIRSILDGKIELNQMEQYISTNVRSVSAQMGADHLQEPFIAGRQTGALGQ